MYDPRICLRRWAALTLCALILAFTSTQPGSAQVVIAGSDYFQTVPGTTHATLPGLGPVDFIGNPIGPANTDTIVMRKADADITGGPATIPIELVALSLKSAAPVSVGGSFFDVFVTLHPDPAHNMGTMTITGNSTKDGGTFDSSFDVFFDVTLMPVGGGTSITTMGVDLGDPMMTTGAGWGILPPLGALLVTGPDPDPLANLHIGVPAGRVDFWPGSEIDPPGSGVRPQWAMVTTEEQMLAAHGVIPAGQVQICPTVPEPSTLVLFGAGLSSLTGVLWRRRRAR